MRPLRRCRTSAEVSAFMDIERAVREQSSLRYDIDDARKRLKKAIADERDARKRFVALVEQGDAEYLQRRRSRRAERIQKATEREAVRAAKRKQREEEERVRAAESAIEVQRERELAEAEHEAEDLRRELAPRGPQTAGNN